MGSSARPSTTSPWSCGWPTAAVPGWPTSASAVIAPTRCAMTAGTSRTTRPAGSRWPTPGTRTWTCSRTGSRSTGSSRGGASWPTSSPPAGGSSPGRLPRALRDRPRPGPRRGGGTLTAVEPVRVLLFDVFGTLVDWRSSLIGIAETAAARASLRADWAAVVDDWRRAYQPAMDRARQDATWRDLDALQRETLADVLARHGVALPAAGRESLVRGWRQLAPWPDSREGLDRLR